MMVPMRKIVLVVLTALLPTAAGPLGAQEHLVVRTEPGTPVVATEVLVAAGPADEAEGQAGLAYLTARVAVAPIRPILDSLGARLQVQGQKDALSFTLIAAPDVWREASRLLLVALFRDPADPGALERERAAIRAELLGREANPADAAAREIDAAVFGADHPWGRPAVGYSATVERLTLEEVDGFIRAHFVPRRTVMAVVGPVDEETGREHLLPFFQGAPLTTSRAEPPRPAESPVRRDYNSITTWVIASYPFAAGADEEALRMLAALATETLSFGPSRRSVYNARSEVLPRAEGGELRIQLVVPPGEVERWAESLRQAVSAHAERPLFPTVFAERLRRFRGERLREMSAPEDRARAAARMLLLEGSGTGPLVDTEALTAERLHDAAQALGAPTLVFLGPFLDVDAPGPAEPAR